MSLMTARIEGSSSTASTRLMMPPLLRERCPGRALPASTASATPAKLAPILVWPGSPSQEVRGSPPAHRERPAEGRRGPRRGSARGRHVDLEDRDGVREAAERDLAQEG